MRKYLSFVDLKKTVFALFLVALIFPTASYSLDKNNNRDYFTIAVISDTQNYVDNNKTQPSSTEVFKLETTYLAAHKNKLKLAFVTHVGDVVQHGDGTDGSAPVYGGSLEWDRAAAAMDILAASGVPFSMNAGNHDYDNYSYSSNSRPLSGTSMWQEYFGSGSDYFNGKSWYGGASDTLLYNPGLSSYQTFVAKGKAFLHIALEMEASDEALAWAQSVIDAHPGYATIVTVHSFLSPPARTDNSMPLDTLAVRTSASYLYNATGGWNDSDGIWNKFIKLNSQIFMVICGHAFNGADATGVSNSENIRIGMNDSGQPVYQILTDYQGNIVSSSGGDGWLRFMEFDMNNGSIHFYTYSPVLNNYAGDEEGESTFNQPAQFSDFVLPMPAQVTNATHGF